MKYKFNPLTGEFNIVPDSGTLKQKLNWLTGNFNLTKDAGKYRQIYNVIEGEFNLYPATTQVVIHGVGSIQLTNAVENGLLSLTAYGGIEQRNLPSEYTQLDYITLNKSFFDTGITPTTDTDYELKFTIASNNTTQGIMGMLNNSTPTNNFYFMVSSGNKFLSALGTSATTLQGLSDPVVDTDYIAKVSGETLTVNGTAAINFSRGTLETTQTINLGCRKNSENNGLTGKLYYFKIWKGGNLVAHYVPCKRNSDDVLGYYDIVNDTFGVLLTTYGTPVAGPDVVPTPSAPMDIVCNNGVVKFGEELFEINDCTDGYYYTATGEYQTAAAARMTDFIPVQVGETYVFKYIANGGPNVRLNYFDTNKTWLNQVITSSSSGTYSYNITPSQDGYIRISANRPNAGSASYLDWDNVSIKAQRIYTDGTVETIAIKNNIFTLVGATYDETITVSGNSSSSQNNGYSDYLAVTGGDIYNFSNRGLSGVALYNQNKVFQSRPSVDTGNYTIPAGIAYIRVNFRQSYMDNISITHTNYTATAEMLLKIGDYVDEQEILSGNITRKVGVKVLDGTENDYAKRSDVAINYTGLTDRVNGTGILGICSHFVCTANNASTAPVGSLFFNVSNIYLHFFTEYGGDVASFKAWLAQQYAAGTPVIILYPLAEETTESVAGQTMNIPAGNSTIEITQASIDNLELEATYEQEA